jgi:hypothetical protein
VRRSIRPSCREWGRRVLLLEATPFLGGEHCCSLWGRPGGGRGGPEAVAAGLPGRGSDVVHAPLRTCHHEWRCVRRPTLDAGVDSGDATSESFVGRHRSRCQLVIIGGGITSLVRQCLSTGVPRRRRGPLGSPYRRRGPWPRRQPATVLWHRLAWPPPRGGSDADAGRAGPGRRQLGGQVGELTLPQGLVLLQA